MRNLYTIFFAILLLQLTACVHYNKVKLSGNTISEQRATSSFRSVSIASLNLYLIQSDEAKVVVEADENVMDYIVTEVVQGQLKIYNRNRALLWNSNHAKVFVFCTDLHELKLSGGADAYSQSLLRFEDFEILASGGSDGKLEVQSQDLYCSVSGGADLRLSGKTNRLDAHVSGGSDLICKELEASKVTVRVSGGSDAYVLANNEASLTASGGSDIYYYGNPPIVSRNSSGGSDIHKKELKF